MSEFNFYQSPEYAQGIGFQEMGLYSQAFDAFFMVEKVGLDRTFRKCCEMARSDQLEERQIECLFIELDEEVWRKNGPAVFNYGLVLEFLEEFEKANQLFLLADALGVPEAKEAALRMLVKMKSSQ